MNVRYRVDLNEDERQELQALVRGGEHKARQGQAGADPAGC